MNNQDLINQMNQMNQNAALYYLADECSRPMTDTEAIILLGFTGFLVLFTAFTIWYSLKD